MSVGWRRAVVGLAVLAFVSCAPDDEAGVSSPPVKYPELIVESGPTPFGVSNFGLLVSDPDGLEWAWKWFGLSGPAPAKGLKREAVLLLAITESGSCPVQYKGFEIVGTTVAIDSATKDGPCTADAHYRSIVLRVPSDLPEGPFRAQIAGQEFSIRRLTSTDRSLRDAILSWFEDVPERQLPEQGVLGGTMAVRVVAFPTDFGGTAGDEFFVLLEDGHIVSTFRYQLTPSLFWEPKERVRHGELPWKRLQIRKSYEVWEMRQGSFAPYMRNY